MKNKLFFCCLFLAVSLALNAAAQTRTLNIYMQDHVRQPIHEDDGRFQFALRNLKEKHPDVQVMLYSIGSLSPEDYQTALLDKEQDIDIITLLNQNVQRYVTSGAVIPLNDHPTIVEAVSTWPPVAVTASDDGKLYAVPHWIKPTLCQINLPDVYEELKLDFSGGWRWNDLFAIKPALDAYNAEHATSYELIAHQNALQQAIGQVAAIVSGGGILPDQSSVESLLCNLKTLNDAVPESNTKAEPSSYLFEFRLVDARNTSSYISIPMIAEETGTSELSICSLMISANSDMTEEALDFLSFYAQPEALQASSEFISAGIYPAGTAADAPLKYVQAIKNGFPRDTSTSAYQRINDAYRAFEDGSLSVKQAADAILSAR